MPSSKNRIYTLLLGLIVMGYFWIIINTIYGHSSLVVCPIKFATGIPCPSCGSTRSVLKLMAGDLYSAILINPFGLIIFLVLILGPLWLLYDYLLKKDSLWIIYNKVEAILKNKKIFIPLILLVLINWIWNICKAL
jgi:hypothetical protein